MKDPAFDEMVTVRVCMKCGRGFPDWAASVSVDGFAVWWTQSETGPLCDGRVINVERRGQIERAQRYGEYLEAHNQWPTGVPAFRPDEVNWEPRGDTNVET